MLTNGHYNELLNTIINPYKATERECDIILCEGADVTDEAASFDVNITADITKNLGCPVLILGRGDQPRSLEEAVSPMQFTYNSFCEKECQVLGLVMNRAQPLGAF